MTNKTQLQATWEFFRGFSTVCFFFIMGWFVLDRRGWLLMTNVRETIVTIAFISIYLYEVWEIWSHPERYNGSI